MSVDTNMAQMKAELSHFWPGQSKKWEENHTEYSVDRAKAYTEQVERAHTEQEERGHTEQEEE